MLPMAVCQSTSVWLNHCYREQAPSHIKPHCGGEILLLFAAITRRNAFLLRVLGRPALEAPHQRLQVWPVRLNEGVVELAVS